MCVRAQYVQSGIHKVGLYVGSVRTEEIYVERGVRTEGLCGQRWGTERGDVRIKECTLRRGVRTGECTDTGNIMTEGIMTEGMYVKWGVRTELVYGQRLFTDKRKVYG